MLLSNFSIKQPVTTVAIIIVLMSLGRSEERRVGKV